MARERSGRGMRRSSWRVKSAVSQPWRCQLAAADLTASRETFPRGRRPHAPLLADPGSEPLRIDPGRVGVGAELGHDPAEHPAIGAAGAGVLGAAERGQISVGGLAERDGGGGQCYVVDGYDAEDLSEVMTPYLS
jgi:hypothetical protein